MIKKKGNILIVDDNKSVLASMELFLKHQFAAVFTLTDPNRITSIMNDEEIDVVLLDMNFTAGINTGNEGIFWLNRIKSIDSSIVVVMITAYGDIELAVKAMKEGAFDFIVKPWDNKKLLATVNAALQLRYSRKEVSILKSQKKHFQTDSEKQFRIIRGKSRVMEDIFSIMLKVAGTDTNILITGENGTGKELIAREIHRISHRSAEIFMPVDLGSISETLFESEMFGHTRGAFTDAKEPRTGRFESASGGTLFLDEISNASLSVQAKLLTSIERRCITPVGSNRSIPLDIRLICATNKDLKETVNNGLFREDLFFRINTVPITIPPLRERKEDIEILAGSFLDHFSTRYGKKGIRLGAQALNKLMNYPWPGNIRELKHTVERAVILSNSDIISPSDLSIEYTPATGLNFQGKVSLDQGEKSIIIKALKVNNGNISETAKQLDIPRQRLYRKMKKYGL
jgi:DNA-binding NtrC family response regulator